uniref:Uncharacterized protein n=1 Tax=Arundo donax TaxID=35708 RepID=A0A0A9E5J6_ARUDO
MLWQKSTTIFFFCEGRVYSGTVQPDNSSQVWARVN